MQKSPITKEYKKGDLVHEGPYIAIYKTYCATDGKELHYRQYNLSRWDSTLIHEFQNALSIVENNSDIKALLTCFGHEYIEHESTMVLVTEALNADINLVFSALKSVRISVIRRWIGLLLEGLSILHSRSIVHSRIHCNCLKFNRSDGVVKLSGYIWMNSTDCDHSLRTEWIKKDYSKGYIPPEVWEQNYWGPMIDIYQLGMSFIHFVTQCEPYGELKSYEDVQQAALRGDPPQGLSLIQSIDASFHDFLASCLLPLDKRPSAAELLNHKFLQETSIVEISLASASIKCELPPAPVNYETFVYSNHFTGREDHTLSSEQLASTESSFPSHANEPSTSSLPLTNSKMSVPSITSPSRGLISLTSSMVSEHSSLRRKSEESLTHSTALTSSSSRSDFPSGSMPSSLSSLPHMERKSGGNSSGIGSMNVYNSNNSNNSINNNNTHNKDNINSYQGRVSERQSSGSYPLSSSMPYVSSSSSSRVERSSGTMQSYLMSSNPTPSRSDQRSLENISSLKSPLNERKSTLTQTLFETEPKLSPSVHMDVRRISPSPQLSTSSSSSMAMHPHSSGTFYSFSVPNMPPQSQSSISPVAHPITVVKPSDVSVKGGNVSVHVSPGNRDPPFSRSPDDVSRSSAPTPVVSSSTLQSSSSSAAAAAVAAGPLKSGQDPMVNKSIEGASRRQSVVDDEMYDINKKMTESRLKSSEMGSSVSVSRPRSVGRSNAGNYGGSAVGFEPQSSSLFSSKDTEYRDLCGMKYFIECFVPFVLLNPSARRSECVKMSFEAIAGVDTPQSIVSELMHSITCYRQSLSTQTGVAVTPLCPDDVQWISASLEAQLQSQMITAICSLTNVERMFGPNDSYACLKTLKDVNDDLVVKFSVPSSIVNSNASPSLTLDVSFPMNPSVNSPEPLASEFMECVREARSKHLFSSLATRNVSTQRPSIDDVKLEAELKNKLEFALLTPIYFEDLRDRSKDPPQRVSCRAISRGDGQSYILEFSIPLISDDAEPMMTNSLTMKVKCNGYESSPVVIVDRLIATNEALLNRFCERRLQVMRVWMIDAASGYLSRISGRVSNKPKKGICEVTCARSKSEDKNIYEITYHITENFINPKAADREDFVAFSVPFNISNEDDEDVYNKTLNELFILCKYNIRENNDVAKALFDKIKECLASARSKKRITDEIMR